MTTTASAHPNIALIKYWGKQPVPGNIPATPSLSITLDTLESVTSVDEAAEDTLLLNGEARSDAKIASYLDLLRQNFDVPPLKIETSNNFPTAAGLASSASGFAALTTAIDQHCDLQMSLDQRSDYARQASGSAARSIYGGFVALGEPDWIAEPLLNSEEWPLKVVIAITDTRQKTVSSSEGMSRSANTSAFYDNWVTTTREDYLAAHVAVRNRDFDQLALLAENSCLKMHAVMTTSIPAMIYWRPATVACIETIRGLQTDGLKVFFTIDAGPQIKAVCTPEHAPQIAEALSVVPGVMSTTTVGLGAGARVIAS
jgi:diphosphomevalonate decarboxylase